MNCRRSPPPLCLLLLALSVATAAAAAVTGCANEQQRRRQQQPSLETPWSKREDSAAPRASSALDPCADRLHDLCHPLLMHFALYRRMPAGLDDLRKMAGPDPAIVFECPLSKQTYGYDPVGLVSATLPGRIVMYDPAPAHGDGMRRAVVIEETKPGQPLIPRVVTIPERDFPRPRPLPTTSPVSTE